MPHTCCIHVKEECYALTLKPRVQRGEHEVRLGLEHREDEQRLGALTKGVAYRGYGLAPRVSSKNLLFFFFSFLESII